MSDKIPSEQEVLGYFDSLSNWGRWGDDDQHGTLNFLSNDNTKRAMGLVKDHVQVSCSRPILFESAADVPADRGEPEDLNQWCGTHRIRAAPAMKRLMRSRAAASCVGKMRWRIMYISEREYFTEIGERVHAAFPGREKARRRSG